MDTTRRTSSSYAKLEDVSEEVTPHLKQNGFNWQFSTRVSSKDEHAIVVLSLTHVQGHEQVHELETPFDYQGLQGKANKTKVQGLTSAITYCKRTLLINALGVTVADEDKDGIDPVAAEPITEEQGFELDDSCAK